MSNDTRRRTRLSAAREKLFARLAFHGRTETVSVGAADGRVTSEAVASPRAVPADSVAATDGYAVRAEDTFAATDRSPAVLRVRSVADESPLPPGEVAAIRTGARLPPNADSVIPDRAVERVDDEIELFDALAEGANVTPAGAVADRDASVVERGDRLRPSALGALRTVGVERVDVAERPAVAVVAVGDGPTPGASVVAALARRWGARVRVERIDADHGAVRETVRAAVGEGADETTDLLHIVGSRDGGPAATGLKAAGRVLARRLAVQPGGDTALAVAEGVPVIASPTGAVDATVGAVALARRAIRTLDGRPTTAPPGRPARLARKLRSAPGVRTFVPVTVRAANGADSPDGGTDDGSSESSDADGAGDAGDTAGATAGDPDDAASIADPLDAAGTPGPLLAARADGWVAVAEPLEGIDAGRRVVVRDWEVGA
ncbi:MAG: molybdopterin molybdenumtransferase MoeA [Halobaculum sp.]